MFNIKNLIFPDSYSCFICGCDIFDNPYFICENCRKELPYMQDNICLHCGIPLVSDGYYCKRCKGRKFWYERALSPFCYKNHISKLVVDLKYNNKKFNAKCLAKFMADCYIKNKFVVDFIVPVPTCEKRLKERGYNQTLLISEELSKLIKVEVKSDTLKRIKETPSQTDLDYSERQINLKDAFKVYKVNKIKNKSILIIDDVFTTGATINECARTLKLAGAKNVYALTFAHTKLEENITEI